MQVWIRTANTGDGRRGCLCISDTQIIYSADILLKSFVSPGPDTLPHYDRYSAPDTPYYYLGDIISGILKIIEYTRRHNPTAPDTEYSANTGPGTDRYCKQSHCQILPGEEPGCCPGDNIRHCVRPGHTAQAAPAGQAQECLISLNPAGFHRAETLKSAGSPLGRSLKTCETSENRRVSVCGNPGDIVKKLPER